MQGYSTPFAVPRARTLLGRAVLAGIATTFYGTIIVFACLKNQPSCLKTAVLAIFFEVFFLLLMAPLLSKSWRPALLLGEYPTHQSLKRYSLLAFPLLGVAIASMFVLYFPLSYVVPRFVEWQLLDQPQMISETSVPANLLSFVYIVLVTPVFEEFVFRGLLLTRWSLKWNARRAVFLSSALFGLGHADIIGAFFTGYVLCMIYIHTKSLLVPMALHGAYNGIVWILEAGDMLIEGSDTQLTLAQYQSFWWVGLLAVVIVSPWVVRFVRQHIPMTGWRVPYQALQESDQHG